MIRVARLTAATVLVAAGCRDSIKPLPARSLSVLAPDSIGFSRSYQRRTIELTVTEANGDPVSGYSITWQSSDTSIVTVGKASSGGEAESLAKDGRAMLRFVISNYGATAEDSIPVIVDRIARGAKLNFTDERKFVSGAFRSWYVSSVDSSGYILDTLPAHASTSDHSIVSVSDTGMLTQATGRAELTVAWEGGELLRDSVEVIEGRDLGEVQRIAVTDLCPSLSQVLVANHALAARRERCLGPTSPSWVFMSLGSPNRHIGDGVAVMRSEGRLLHVSGDPFTLRQYDANGDVRWSVVDAAGSGAASELAVTSDGVVFVRSAGHVTSVDSAGVKWTAAVPGVLGLATMGVENDVALLVITPDSVLRFSGAGNVLWRRGLGGLSSQALGGDGRLFAWRRSTNSVIAVSSAGEVLWEKTVAPVPSYERAWLVVGPGERLLVAGESELVGFSPSGEQLWRLPMAAAGKPVVATDGLVYVIEGSDGHIAIIDPVSGTLVARTTNGLGRGVYSHDDLALGDAVLAGTDGATINWFKVPFGPAAGWSQPSGNGGATNAPTQP